MIISSFETGQAGPSTTATERYKVRFNELQEASEDWLISLEDPKKQPDLNTYYTFRSAYKRVEFIWEFLEPNLIKEFLNASPFPKLDKSAPNLTIMEPKGFQILDELLFADSVDHEKIVAKSKELNQIIQQAVPPQKLYDRVIFDAIRIGLIRHFTLGLSGFDLPSSDPEKTLREASIFMDEITIYLRVYEEEMGSIDPEKSMQIFDLLGKGKMLLISKTYADFDYLSYLVEVLNPLFAGIQEIRLNMGIESHYEAAPGVRFAVNFNSKGLFEPDFLDPLYYVSFPKDFYTPELIELGRFAFFDPILSANKERACASCHHPDKAFSDGLAKSVAFDRDGFLDRNAPGLINSVYSERFFHDLRAEAFEDQLEHVVVNAKEFNHSILGILGRLDSSSEYKELFARAFPDQANPLNQQNFSFAISAYVASLQSFHSPFDQFVRGEIGTIEPAVVRGFNLFMGKAACATCHFAPVFNGTVPPFFTESESEVLGVPADTSTVHPQLDPDPGRYSAKLKENAPFYRHSFKTPSLRNVALTGPYMHNGVYQTLEEVMDFYNRGGGIGLRLEVPFQTLSSEPLELTDTEIKDLIAFLRSLTDERSHYPAPESLPKLDRSAERKPRKIGGVY